MTFKHREGGSVVPWEGLESGVVYEPIAGVKIPYMKSDGTEGECKFFSKMLGASQYDRALVCHASSADAKAYQKNGDVSKVLPYKSAGGWCTPDLPTLKGQSVALAHLDLAPKSMEPLSRVCAERRRGEVSLAEPHTTTAMTPRKPPDIDYEYLADLVAARLRGPSAASSFEVVGPNEQEPQFPCH